MAQKKAAGSAKNLKDSNPKYRGVKLFGGQIATAGNIIVRQKGEKFVAGTNTYLGRDKTIHASIDGVVIFSKKNILRFDGRKYLKTIVSVLPHYIQKDVMIQQIKKDITTGTVVDDVSDSLSSLPSHTDSKKTSTKTSNKRSTTSKKTSPSATNIKRTAGKKKNTSATTTKKSTKKSVKATI